MGFAVRTVLEKKREKAVRYHDGALAIVPPTAAFVSGVFRHCPLPPPPPFRFRQFARNLRKPSLRARLEIPRPSFLRHLGR